jgi:hypothetical protein
MPERAGAAAGAIRSWPAKRAECHKWRDRYHGEGAADFASDADLRPVRERSSRDQVDISGPRQPGFRQEGWRLDRRPMTVVGGHGAPICVRLWRGRT